MQHPPSRAAPAQPLRPGRRGQLREYLRDRDLAVGADPPRPIRAQPLGVSAARGLATVIDCHTRMVIGYAMADNYKTPLIEADESASG